MKKALTLFCAAVMILAFVLSVASCGEKTPGGETTKTPETTKAPDTTKALDTTQPPVKEKTVKEILDLMYADKAYNEETSPEYYVDREIDEDSEEYFFGTKLDYEDAIASEPDIGWGYSVCIVRVKDGDKASDIAEKIKATADPMKWVCTGASTCNVYYSGDTVALIMCSLDLEPILKNAFYSAMGE